MYLPETAQELGPAHSFESRSRQERFYELLRPAILDGRLTEGSFGISCEAII
jgi:DNA-binding GntR family transcriptional regulator